MKVAVNKLTVDANNSVLLIIDFQQGLARAMPEKIKQHVEHQTSVLLKAANTLAVPTIVTEQYPKGLGSTEPALSELFVADQEVVEKTCFSCLRCMTFCQSLSDKQCKQVVLTGMESHICILQSALALHADGYQVFVVEDAICSRNQRDHDSALHRLRQAGVIVTTTEAVLFEWLGDAKHADFKTLSRLIV